jgi:DNA-directed RNA polymerase specialized sigma24 family protein
MVRAVRTCEVQMSPDRTGPERQRFEDLYATHHAPVFAYVLRRTDVPEDAADVIAETFAIAWRRRWRRIDDVPSGEETRLWLYGVVRRVLANHRRGLRRRSSLADRLRAELAPAPHPYEER